MKDIFYSIFSVPLFVFAIIYFITLLRTLWFIFVFTWGLTTSDIRLLVKKIRDLNEQ